MSGRPVRAEQGLHEVRLQPLAEQREARPRADVGAQRHPHAALDVPAQREQPAAQRAVARRAVRDRRARLRQHVQLGVVGVDVVREHAAPAEEPAPVVGVGVVLVIREQPAHGVDLGAVLVDVRGEQRAVDVAEHRRARLEHRIARRQREPRGDGVAQPVLAVPSGGERDALGVGLLRGGQQLRPQHAVADDEPGGDPQPDRRGPLEQQRRRRRGSARRRRAPSSCRPAAGRRRTRPRRRARSRRRPSGPPPATRTPRASPAAACRARRSPGPAGSGRGCRRGRAAARRRSGRRPRRPAVRPARGRTVRGRRRHRPRRRARSPARHAGGRRRTAIRGCPGRWRGRSS